MSNDKKRPAVPAIGDATPAAKKWAPKFQHALSVREAEPNVWNVEDVEYDADGNSEIHVLFTDPSEIIATAKFAEYVRGYVAYTRSGYKVDPTGTWGAK